MAYHIIKPGTTALRTPYFPEMLKLHKQQFITFDEYRISRESLIDILKHYEFNHNKPITKSILAWWAFQNPDQEVPNFSEVFDTEHIYSRNRKRHEDIDISDDEIESIGNKSLLERTINIRASDYKFTDKKEYYQGKMNSRNRTPKPTVIKDLLQLCENNQDFTVADIKQRENDILGKFINKIEENGLLQ